MHSQATLLELPPPEPRKIEVSGVDNPVARVVLDLSLPHLNYPLDYLVPEKLAETAGVGTLVEVRLGSKKYRAWVVERTSQTLHRGRLSALQKVISKISLISHKQFEFCRAVSDYYCGCIADVVNASCPARQVAVEDDFKWQVAPAKSTLLPAANIQSWELYPAGRAWLERLSEGGNPRGIWDCLPDSANPWYECLVESALATMHSHRRVVIVVPTVHQVEQVMTVIRSRGLAGTTAQLHSGLDRPTRFREYLRALHGQAEVVVGTRSACLAPLNNVGLYACFDDANALLRCPRAPYFDAAKVLQIRAEIDGAAAIFGGFSRSLYSQQLISCGWAAPIVANRPTVRQQVPSVMVPKTEDLFERYGAAGTSRFPPGAVSLVSESIDNGPVLLSVPRSGFVNVVACQYCHHRLRCPHCGGPVKANAKKQIYCQWCQRNLATQGCAKCGKSGWLAKSIGSSLTAQEIGRMFPGYRVTLSGAGSVVVDTVDDRPRLVIATPGAEPQAEGGYSAVIILDSYALSARPELWAPPEAARRFFNILALAKPRSKCLVLGNYDPLLAEALSRWNPGKLAELWLSERDELNFPPTVSMIALDGLVGELRGLAARLPLAESTEVLGPYLTPNQSFPARLLLRSPLQQGQNLREIVFAEMRSRTSRRAPKIRVTVDPTELY